MERTKSSYQTKKNTVVLAIEEGKAELEKEPLDKLKLIQIDQKLSRCLERFILASDSLMDALIRSNPDDDAIPVLDVEQSEVYGDVKTLQTQIKQTTTQTTAPQKDNVDLGHAKTHRLPKLELPKFGGEIRDWLPFWNAFSTAVDDNPEITPTVKFQYLKSCMPRETNAYDIVSSYNLSDEDYPKAIQDLKDRYGREDMLVQVYIRELLTLILDKTGSFSTHYVKLTSQLRALASLKVTKDRYAAILFPMVETTLPDDIQEAWQRSRHQQGKNEDPHKTESEFQLDQLLEFLKNEVEGRERMKLARQPFSSCSQSHQMEKRNNGSKPSIPTAASFVTSDKKAATPSCVFCDGKHPSENCCKAMSMTYEDKKTKVNQKRACFSCLRSGHDSKRCKAIVKCLLCSKKHWAILCPDAPAATKDKSKDKPDEEHNCANKVNSAEILLQTLAVRIGGDSKTKIVRAMLDGGSQHSYILKSTAAELQLKKVGEREVVHVVFGGHQSQPVLHCNYSCNISDMDGSFSQVLQVDDSESICGRLPTANNPRILEEIHRKNIKFHDLPNAEIEILIGADIYGKILTGKKVELSSGPVALQTKLGWTLTGAVKTSSKQSTAVSLHIRDATVQELWSLDTIGIMDPMKEKTRKETINDLMRNFESTLKRAADGRYSVKLPWIINSKPLPSYKFIAIKKLEATTKTLRRLDKLQAYHEVFKGWEAEGVIERCAGGNGHYISHHGVLKPESETTPVRPVFNASFSCNGSPSLNDCLEVGPNMLEEIPDLLLRFRKKPVGITSDIRKAFLQVGLEECERDNVRFLWYSDDTFDEVQEFRHCRVVFGVNCSPFLLAAVINHHLDSYPPEMKTTTQLLKQSFYVDNCVTSLNTLEDALLFKEESIQILKEASMDLRCWEIGPSREEKTVSVLGLSWNVKSDVLFCDVKKTLKKLDPADKITRRKVLSVTHSIFDPLGITCAFTIIPKMILQDTYKLRLGWDTPLPADLSRRFTCWTQQLSEINLLQVPRCLAKNQNKNTWSFHVFTDSSGSAYGTCAYLRSGSADQIEVSLVMARSRLAPLQETTIPRLELVACLCGARLHKRILEQLETPEIPVHFWTDSSCALAWIRNDNKYSTFVTNRVKSIRELSRTEQWRHVPGSMNPADVPSRGSSIRHLLETRWLQGPQWLKEDSNTWPSEPVNQKQTEVDEELCETTTVQVCTEAEDLLNKLNKFSDYSKILRVVVHLRRYFHWISCKLQKKTFTCTPTISKEELQEAELKVLQLIQQKSFVNLQSQRLRSLKCFVDATGVIRVKTRLFSGDERGHSSPIVLPAKEETVQKLIWEHHCLNCHATVGMIQSQLREKYWLLSSCKTIQRVLRSCVKCRRFKSRPVQVEQGPLPSDRSHVGDPWRTTGVDMFGPLHTKNKSKIYVALFTCGTYRAVHLEMCTALTTENFIMALRRFVARRGRPEVIYSDNGLNFVGCRNLLKSLNWKQIQDYANAKEISWKLNPPTGSWWGGFWERLIGIIKPMLKSVLGNSRVNNQELETLLCDVESNMNDRPLTYITENDTLQPLTPNMFMRTNSSSSLPDVDVIERDHLGNHFRNLQAARDELRSRFRKEYLSLLVQRGNNTKSRILTVGEVVLIGDDNRKPLFWPLGVIQEVLPGPDGNVRVARVKTQHGVFLRPVQRLYPLEITCNKQTTKITN